MTVYQSPAAKRMKLSKLPVLSCASILALCSVSAAANPVSDAQEEVGEASEAANTRRTFTPEDFARFAPRNALDMARQIPGFSLQSGDNARGLGQADSNVLINGRRISGKSNGPIEALGRIPTEEVVRLELVDGASLDIGGLSGQVLNIITSSTGGITGQFRYSPEFRSTGTPARLLNGSISLAGGGEKDEWTLALNSDSQRFGNAGIERVFDGDGNLIDTRDERANFAPNRISLSGSYARTASNGNVLNATGEVQGFFFERTETSLQSGTINPVDRERVFTGEEDEFNFELGLDYDFVLGPGRLKLIGLHRFENSPIVTEVITNFADGSPPQGSVFDRNADEFESILRGEYNLDGLGGNLLFAAEGVRNILDQTSTLEVRDNAGVLQPEPLDGASARVEEDRAEVSVTYSRALADNLQFQGSLGGEYSKISQTGAQGQTRTFYRPKGFVSLDWKANDNLNISGRIEREVGQLNFFNFLASVNLNQNLSNVTNANLVPPQSWVFEVESTLSLDDLGSLNLRAFYEDITDIVDQIPIAGGGQAPGNVPSAESYGFDTNLTLLSEGIGWAGTRLDLDLQVRDSSVLDPLLGTPRDLSGLTKARIDVDLRHDLPETSWALGGFYRWRDNAPRVRLDDIALRSESTGFVGAFVENKDIGGLTVRLTVANLTDNSERFDRTVFTDRAAGIVDFVEDQDRKFGMIFTLDIDGSF